MPTLVTPPMKNVRKRRFRRVARQKTQDHDEIEKEVRRLFRSLIREGFRLPSTLFFYHDHFRADNEAIEITWEVIEDDQEVEISKPIEKDELSKRYKNDTARFMTLHLGQHDLFGGDLSESDEDETSQKGAFELLKKGDVTRRSVEHLGLADHSQASNSVEQPNELDGLFHAGIGDLSNSDVDDP
jgi:TATA-binding protein-associated factor Taf7